MKYGGDIWRQAMRAVGDKYWDALSVERALAVLRRFRSVRRQQVNRDNVEHSDLGGEG